MRDKIDGTERRRRPGRMAIRSVLCVAAFGALGLLFGYAVMGLWNSVVAEVFAVHRLTYWQAVGLLVLCRLLVGGLHQKPSRPRERLRLLSERTGARPICGSRPAGRCPRLVLVNAT